MPVWIGRGILWWVVAVALCQAGTAFGQELTGNADLEDLRKRAPSGDNDIGIIDGWLQAEVAKITTGNAPSGGLRNILQTVRNDPATTGEFRQALAERLGELANTELGQGTTIPASAAMELAWAVIETNDPQTQAGLTAALGHADQSVRYLGAKGLEALRARIAAKGPAEKQLMVDALKQAGTKETNGVVVDRIYGALSFPTATDEVLDAIGAIFDARLARYGNGANLTDEAEAGAVEYLANATLNPAQEQRAVRRLATLLRLDVERYSTEKAGATERDILQRRIYACEEFISRIVKPAAGTGGNVCQAMSVQGRAAIPAMQLELLNWIGSPEQEGVLNATPWNLPVGAPLPNP